MTAAGKLLGDALILPKATSKAAPTAQSAPGDADARGPAMRVTEAAASHRLHITELLVWRQLFSFPLIISLPCSPDLRYPPGRLHTPHFLRLLTWQYFILLIPLKLHNFVVLPTLSFNSRTRQKHSLKARPTPSKHPPVFTWQNNTYCLLPRSVCPQTHMAEAPGCHLHKSTEEVFPAHCCLTEVLGLTLGNGAGHSCARGRAGFYIMLMHSGTSGWENGSSPPPAAGEPPGNQLKCHTNPTANQRDGFRGIMVQISCSRGSTGHSVWGHCCPHAGVALQRSSPPMWVCSACSSWHHEWPYTPSASM